MEFIIETSMGEVTFRTAIIDVNGTDLVEGIEVLIDGTLEKELFGYRLFYFEEMSLEEVEEFLREKFIYSWIISKECSILFGFTKKYSYLCSVAEGNEA